MRGQDSPSGPKREPGRKVVLPLGRRRGGGAAGSLLSPQQPVFPGARAGAGAAAGRGRSLGQGQRCGMLQGTAPPRGDEHVPSTRGGGCAGGHSPPAPPPGSLPAVLAHWLGAWGEWAAALQRRCPWRRGERGASWAWGDPAPHHTLGTHSRDIRTELITHPRALPSQIPRDNGDGGVQRGQTWPSLLPAWWLPS